MPRLLALVLFFAVTACAQTIFVVRHAEKISEDADALSDVGKQRAACLANTLKDAEVKAIYVSQTARARETGMPLAKKLQLTETELPAKAYDVLVARIHANPGQNALIVGHSNTIPDIVKALGAERPADNDDFDWLYIVTIEGNSVRFTKLHYCGVSQSASMRMDH